MENNRIVGLGECTKEESRDVVIVHLKRIYKVDRSFCHTSCTVCLHVHLKKRKGMYAFDQIPLYLCINCQLSIDRGGVWRGALTEFSP
jgi:hypothetical protein